MNGQILLRDSYKISTLFHVFSCTVLYILCVGRTGGESQRTQNAPDLTYYGKLLSVITSFTAIRPLFITVAGWAVAAVVAGLRARCCAT